MHSTLKLRESDPHDIFAIEPDPVPVAWADKVLADIKGEAGTQPSEEVAPVQPPLAVSAAGAAAPAVDTTFRATAIDDIHVPDIQVPDIQVPSDLAADRPSTSKWAKSAVMLIFAVCSAAAAAAWQHHGDAAKQMISAWVPTFALTSSPSTEKAGVAGPSDTPAVVQAAAAEQTSPQPAAPAQPPQGVVPAAAGPSPDTAQLVQSMGRDLAAMGQQIEQLKASVAELKASQQAMARDAAKPAEVRASVPNPRTKMSALPPRPAAAPARRPMPAYQPVQAAAPAPLPPPQAAPPYASPPPAPYAPQAVDQGDEPVVRPPMPLR
jgi:hypothetical protein